MGGEDEMGSPEGGITLTKTTHAQTHIHLISSARRTCVQAISMYSTQMCASYLYVYDTTVYGCTPSTCDNLFYHTIRTYSTIPFLVWSFITELKGQVKPDLRCCLDSSNDTAEFGHSRPRGMVRDHRHRPSCPDLNSIVSHNTGPWICACDACDVCAVRARAQRVVA